MMNVGPKVALGHVGKMSGTVIRHERSRASPRQTSMEGWSWLRRAPRRRRFTSVIKFWPPT